MVTADDPQCVWGASKQFAASSKNLTTEIVDESDHHALLDTASSSSLDHVNGLLRVDAAGRQNCTKMDGGGASV